MQKIILPFIIFTLLLVRINPSLAQAPDLGASSTFALFTAAGAFNGDPATSVVGDIGTDVGAFTPPGFLVGAIHVSDPVSAQAAADVASAYGFLAGLTCGSVLATPFGNNQTLAPNIYCIGSAAVLNANLTLDGGGDPGAIFIFQIDGALTTNPGSNIFLTNGANLCNVYWQVNGAFNHDGTLFQGTVIAAGAINLGFGAQLNGRGLSTQGAISTSANIVSLPNSCLCDLDVTCPNPSGGTFQCEGDIPAGATTDVTVNSACGTASVVITETASGNGCANSPYVLLRTYTVSDDGGHVAECIVTYAAVDNIPPTITCPTVTASVECPATPTFPAATATDICDATPTITFVDVSTPGGLCIQEYSVTRTWTATDDCGNAAQCNQTISVTDNNPPVITCPTVTAVVECSDISNFLVATAVDLCDGNPTITFLDVRTPGGLCPQEYTLTRTWTATDACGNAAMCARTISVTDNNAPVLNCPTVVASVECPATPIFPAATASDLCDVLPTITFADVSTPGLCPQEFSVTRTWTATDACGNISMCNRTIVVTDNTAPVIVCPTVVASVECPATPTFPAATASDLCDATPTITFATVTTPGLCPQEFSLTRTWTATDDCGNASICNRTISVTDNTAPVIICPTVVASIECPATPTFPAATASDLCDATPTITFLDVSTPGGLCIQEYSVTRTWTATDDCGNAAQCNRTISVTDNTAPTFDNPPLSVTVECTSIPSIPTLPSASDNCTGAVSVSFLGEIQTPGICPILYTLTRTWRAVDDCGNSSTTSQVVTVVDTQAPVFIQIPADVVLDCNLATNPDAFQDWLADQGDAIVSDCSSITWTFTDSPFFIMPSECGGTSLRFIRFIATDACGNSAFRDASFRVQDTIPPNFNILPQNLTMECIEGDQGEAVLPDWLNNFGFAQVSDDCGSVTTQVVFISKHLDCGNAFTSTYEFRATDECGNTNFVTATFAIVDNTPPVIVTCPEGNVLLTCEFSIPQPDTAGVVAYDYCGAITVSLEGEFTAGVGCLFSKAYTYAVTDACGNVSTCYQSFQVVDSIPPIYTGPDTIAVLCVADLPTIGEIAGILAPYFSDNCYDIICVNEGVALSGVNWVTYCIKAKDLCVNWTEKFFVTFIATGGCKPLCSAPQTVWGKTTGAINGMSTTTATEQLISKYGPLKAGKLGKIISVNHASCLQTMLPGNGSTAQFSPGIHEFGLDNQCNPSSPVLNADGTLKNKLAANVLALQLNIWYNQEFNERDLGVQPMSSLPLCLVETIVVNKLEENHSNVQGLLNLSNDYLAGVGFYPPNFGNPLNSAVENLNNYWQNCQTTDPCSGSASVAGYLKTESLDGLEAAKVQLDGSNNAGPMPSLVTQTDAAGYYEFTNALPMLGGYTITPNSDDMGYLNGVTTYDLVLISRHILGWAPLNSPYKMIAADANRSGSITTFDIVELRKLILGVYVQLPSNTPWRFIDGAYVFQEPSNPFANVFPEQKTKESIQVSQMAEDFVSVKIGDVNGSAHASGLHKSDERNGGVLLFDVNDSQVTAGETFELKFTADQIVQGYQFTLNTEGLEVLEVSGAAMSMSNFAVFATDGALTTSWNLPEGMDTEIAEFSLRFRAIRSGKLSEMLSISSRITKVEAYRKQHANSISQAPLDVALRFHNNNGVSISGMGFELYQNVPNPFVDKTTIGFYLPATGGPEATEVTLTIFDETGRQVFSQKGDFPKGYNAFTIEHALIQTNGTLLYKLETATDRAIRKMFQAK